MKKLTNRNIVKFLDAYQTSNNTYIITEYCKGGDLKNLMQQKKIFTEKESIIIIK